MTRILESYAGITGIALLFATLTSWAADESPPDAVATNSTLTLSQSDIKRAQWQEHLTLGPSDVLSISMVDNPDSARESVVIGPDGRISYLQVENLVASGLTIDELRAKLDTELAKFYRMPRSIIIPVSYNSKKYYVLGTVAATGVFPLNRPTTVIQALALAGGLRTGVILQTGVIEQRNVDLADLTRSFLVRNGKRVDVDFERLFEKGDLSQNVELEPEDYLYFASASANEIYVLGEVNQPGVLSFAPKETVISAIVLHGGFSDRAWKSKVLVVRGSLNHPETFVVDTAAILAGKAPDFKLEQKDIIYVSANPWSTAVDVLDTAARAFVQAFVVQATSLKVGPLITTPLINP